MGQEIMSRSGREADLEGKLFPGEGLVETDYEWAVAVPFAKLANPNFNPGSECVDILTYCHLNQWEVKDATDCR